MPDSGEIFQILGNTLTTVSEIFVLKKKRLMMTATRTSSVSSVESEDNLLDMEVLDKDDSTWLVPGDKDDDEELAWLRKDLENSCSIFMGNKNSLVKRLESLSKGN